MPTTAASALTGLSATPTAGHSCSLGVIGCGGLIGRLVGCTCARVTLVLVTVCCRFIIYGAGVTGCCGVAADAPRLGIGLSGSHGCFGLVVVRGWIVSASTVIGCGGLLAVWTCRLVTSCRMFIAVSGVTSWLVTVCATVS